jgi:hypothetical protein
MYVCQHNIVSCDVAVNIINTTIENQSQEIGQQYLIQHLKVSYLVHCAKMNYQNELISQCFELN